MIGDKLTADGLVNLLEARHSKDVFVTQCKSGSSWARDRGQLRILDAWALERSYCPIRMVGYEIKISRQDFLKDTKWPEYLKLCNEFYFVCPRGLIDPTELPAEVGLLSSSKNVKRLQTIRRAAYREIEPPLDLLVYILITRAKISRTEFDTPEYWRALVEDDQRNKEIGHNASIKIREHVVRLEKENRNLTYRIKDLENIKAALSEAGIRESYQGGFDSHTLRQRLQSANKPLPSNVERRVRGFGESLISLANDLEKYRLAE